jgi:hypothetical protein
MMLLQNKYNKHTKTHAWHNGMPMCGTSGDYIEAEGDAPTCTWCLIASGLQVRDTGHKIGKRMARKTESRSRPRHNLRMFE